MTSGTRRPRPSGCGCSTRARTTSAACTAAGSGGRERDRAAPTAGPGVRALMAFRGARASALLSAGSPLIATLRGTARLAVAGYVAGGRAALAAIEAAGYDVLAAAPRPGKRR